MGKDDNNLIENNSKDLKYLNTYNIEYLNNGLISIHDGVMSDIKNCDAILTSVNTNLVFLDGNSSIDVSDLVEYSELKELVDTSNKVLNCGDSYVFTVRKDSALSKRGISYVIAIITPEWENGLNRYDIVSQMDKGLDEAFILAGYYDIDSIVISNLYPYMPVPLVMDLISHYLVNVVGDFKELCVVRGSDAEGVYRINVLLSKLTQKYENSIYIRVGGDIENDYLTPIIFNKDIEVYEEEEVRDIKEGV